MASNVKDEFDMDEEKDYETPLYYDQQPRQQRRVKAYMEEKENSSSVTSLSRVLCVMIIILIAILIAQYAEKEILQQSYDEQSKLLEEAQKVASIYQKQLHLIQTIGKAIGNMHDCFIKLEKYCLLKAKPVAELSDFEHWQMENTKTSLGCTEELSADHHAKIKSSFEEYVMNAVKFQKVQENFMTSGDINMMAAEQNRRSNVQCILGYPNTSVPKV